MKSNKNRIEWLINSGLLIGAGILILFALKGLALIYLLIKGLLWMESLG